MRHTHRGTDAGSAGGEVLPTAAVDADDPVAPLAPLLLRYLWPFALFKDAANGDRLTRAAAYRHNRAMRLYLPRYLRRWLGIGAGSYGLICVSESLAAHPLSMADPFAMLTVASTLGLASAISVLVVTAYVYLYLCRHEN